MILSQDIKSQTHVMAIETDRGVGPWKKPSAKDVTNLTAAGQGDTAQVKGIVSNGRAGIMM